MARFDPSSRATRLIFGALMAACSAPLFSETSGTAASNPGSADAGEALAVPAAKPRPTFTSEGYVNVPAFILPPSPLMSKDAVEALKARENMRLPAMSANIDISMMRKGMEMFLAPQVEKMKANYPVDIVDGQVAGVNVRIVTPKGKPIARDKVLINLHGGGFMMCAEACALLESIPIAAVGGYKVITVDYRQGPENVFPAASEDVTAVYVDLLKTYKPSKIGIYGCSAGGALTGQVAAWLQEEKLPVPGALGIFGSGAGRVQRSDSAYIAANIDGSFPAPPLPGEASGTSAMQSYFREIGYDDRLVSPMYYLNILRDFPPTLLITGTRAADLSPVVYTHAQLRKAGADADLLVAEGMGHCYINSPDLPEAQDAFQLITEFFDKNLKK